MRDHVQKLGQPKLCPPRRPTMSSRTYRLTEIVGTSETGIDDAIQNGITRAAQTLRHLDWFEVTQIRGQIVDGAVEHVQVGMKVGFRLEDS
jgi:flavin-binding protein dodecin